jgi:hypothetical protein
MINDRHSISTWTLSAIALLALSIYPFFARHYFYESFMQFNYALGAEPVDSPKFLETHMSFWWLWFAFPLVLVASTILYAKSALSEHWQLCVVGIVLGTFVVGTWLCFHLHATAWLRTFGKIV